MQKRRLPLLLCFVLLICLLASCGKNGDNHKESGKETQTEQGSSETGESVDKTEDSKEDSLTENQTTNTQDTESPDSEMDSTKTDEPVSSETESESGLEPASETGEPAFEPKASETEEPTETQYTYKALNKTMYVTDGVNVRDLPSSDGKKLGSLSEGDAVTVTGQCNETKWYRIAYNNQTGYVSNKYLTDTKPQESTEEPAPPTPSGPTDTVSNGWENVPDFSGKDYSAEYMAQTIVDCIITDSMSDFEKAITIHDWLTFNLDYDHTFTNYHVKEALRDRTCVCQGYAEAFEMMAEMAGLEASFVGGTGINSKGELESHAWNQVKVDGTWYNVDVTWDDPSNGAGKDPDDHSGNRYDYFLVSKTELSKDHTADDYHEGEKSCPQTYDRVKILKYAANSGLYGDVVFVQNTDDANTAIKKYMDANKTSAMLWIYDTSITDSNKAAYLQNFIAGLKYLVTPASTFLFSDDGIIKCQISFKTSSEWNSIPVVTNVTEFKALLDQKGDAGVSNYTVRYEPASGEPQIDASKYGFMISYNTYNGGNWWFATVTIK